jgi:MFS family permease
MPGTAASARRALASRDFRRLFAIRLVSQSADGLFQAALVASVVFSPEDQSTASGFAVAVLLISLPFSVVGPFTGVFIDRWSRRAILVVTPLLRVAVAWLVLFEPSSAPVLFYAGAVWVLSVNRFYLATAVAVVPRLVPTEDLLMANSLSVVGGTVALLFGAFVGGQLVDAFGNGLVVAVASGAWLVASAIAGRITSPMNPHTLPEAPVGAEVRRVLREFADGASRLWHTPRAIGPITSISLDQMGQGLVLVVSLVVFRDRFEEGVASFSNLLGAGGIGVLLGIATVGPLARRFGKERLVAGAFVVGGLTLIAVGFFVTQVSVLVASFAIGLTFAWKKIPVDTLVQASLPDGYRGRVFAVYDVAYNLARVFAALLAIPLIPALGAEGTVALVGIVFLLWSPVLPLWLSRAPQVGVRFYEGGRAEEEPRAIVWGGVEEPVTVERRALEERDGERRMRYRLALQDGTVVDISKADAERDWRLEREFD